MNKSFIRCLTLLTLIGLTAGCAGSSAPTESENESNQPPQGDLALSNQAYDSNPNVSESALEQLASGNASFAFDLYRSLDEGDGNLFLSPYSISMALAMTYAGARGETQQQMAETLHFDLSQEQLHPAFNLLTLTLLSRSQTPEGDGFKFNIANALWAQRDYIFLDAFLDTLAVNYDAGMQLVDFVASPEEARDRINQWVADQTEDKIKDIIPEGALNALTRLVLTNAIYFKAAWASQFMPEATQEESFTTLDGSQITASLMHQTGYYKYALRDGVTMVELPYVGNELSMIVFMPPIEQFHSFEDSLTPDGIQARIDSLESTNIRLAFPSFEFESEFGLSQTLSALGMPDAFGPEADFSGMDGSQDLLIQNVIHKAYISVDEEGTEAAAATAVIVGATSLGEEPIEVRIDHPFFFLIRDRQTGAILFMGRLTMP